jgi:hypothetical protein
MHLRSGLLIAGAPPPYARRPPQSPRLDQLTLHIREMKGGGYRLKESMQCQRQP